MNTGDAPDGGTGRDSNGSTGGDTGESTGRDPGRGTGGGTGPGTSAGRGTSTSLGRATGRGAGDKTSESTGRDTGRGTSASAGRDTSASPGRATGRGAGDKTSESTGRDTGRGTSAGRGASASAGFDTGLGAGAQFGLEVRARAAVLATADEIRVEDVPPAPAWLAGEPADRAGRPGDRKWRGVRVGRGERARRDDWDGFGGPRGAGRWGVPLAAAAAVVMAAGVTTALTVNRISQGAEVAATATAYATPAGAGLATAAAAKRETAAQRSAAAAQATATKQAAPVAAATPAQVPSPAELEAGLIGLFVPASGAQYSAGVAFQGEYQALESQVTGSCLAKAGFAAANVSPAPVTGPGASLARYPDLAAITKAGALPGSGSRVVVNPSSSPPPTGASIQCSAAAGELFNGMVTAGLKLGEPFTAAVIKIQGSAPVLATVPALRSCAAKYGWPGSGPPINSFADFASWVSGQVNTARTLELSPEALRKTNAWWASAFVQCAAPTVTVMEKLQVTAQQSYLASHKEQFGALVAVAEAAFAKAVQASRG